MGNLQKVMRERDNLRHQNKALNLALARRNAIIAENNERVDAALEKVSVAMTGYIGAICLSQPEMTLHISRADVNKAIGEYHVLVSQDDTGFTFKLVEK